MGKEKIKTKKGMLLLTNKLGKFERLNQEELKIITNHAVQGLAPVSVIAKRKKITMQVAQRNWYPLSLYMDAPMDPETALAYIWNTLRIAFDCERYGLRIDNLCWDASRVFMDATDGTLHMLYWPVTSLEPKQANALTFYFKFYQVLARSGADEAIVNTYGSFFYQRSQFDFPLFYRTVQDVLDLWRRSRMREKIKEAERRKQANYISPKPDKRFDVSSGWLESLESGEKIFLNCEKMTVGRDPGHCGLLITGNTGISRCHAVIINRDNQYYLEDLESRNGTFVQDGRLKPHERVYLVDGMKVSFAGSAYVFHKNELTKTVSIHDLQRR